jgi:hypothetical protein
MPSAGFEPTIPATKRQQTYTLDRAATRIGCPENNASCFFCSKYLLKIIKITHIQVGRFVSKPYFSAESLSTSTALHQ